MEVRRWRLEACPVHLGSGIGLLELFTCFHLIGHIDVSEEAFKWASQLIGPLIEPCTVDLES